MNWEKILGLNAEKLNQSIKWFIWLYFFYVLITLLTSYRKSNEMVIPIEFTMEESGIWTVSSNDTYEVKTKHGRAELLVETNGYPKELLLGKVGDLLYYLVIAFILWQLKGLSQSIKDKIPFEKANILRVRKIGFAFLFLTVIQPVFYRYLAKSAVQYVDIANLELKVISNFNWPYYFIGLVFLLISHVFKKGIELREENALTI